jgi:hypothetical protein
VGEGVGGAGGDKYGDVGVDVDAEGVLFGAVGEDGLLRGWRERWAGIKCGYECAELYSMCGILRSDWRLERRVFRGYLKCI